MIDPVLKKFGMFQARKSVKNYKQSQYISKTPPKNFTTTKKVQNKSPIPSASPFHTHSHSNIQPPTYSHTPQKLPTVQSPIQSKLQQLINFLQSNYKKSCTHAGHHINKVKFVCLSQSCVSGDALGCAQCFIYRHNEHEKAEIGVCIRELEDLDRLVRESNQVIMMHKNIIRDQFINQIDLQISNMQTQFLHCLQHLKNKALKQLTDNLYARYQQNQTLSLLRSPESASLPMSHSQLMTELIKLDIKAIQCDIELQIQQLSVQKYYYQPIVRVFEDMSVGLGGWIANWKGKVPRVYRINQGVLGADLVNDSSIIREEAKFNMLNAFRSDPHDTGGRNQVRVFEDE